MKNIPLLLLCCLFASLLFSGCATILAPGYQKVTIKTKTQGAVIVVANDTLGTDSVIVKCRKKNIYAGCEVAKEGFKIRAYCFQLRHVSPSVAFMAGEIAIAAVILVGLGTYEFAIPFAYSYLFPMLLIDLGTPKIRAFSRHQFVPDLLPLDCRKANERRLHLDTVIFAHADATTHIASHTGVDDYNSGRNEENEFINHRKVRQRDKLNIGAKDIRKNFDGFLSGLDFYDSVSAARTGALRLKAIVTNVQFHSIGRLRKPGAGVNSVPVALELAINWEIADDEGKVIKTIDTDEESSLHIFSAFLSVEERQQEVKKLLQDNIAYSFLKLKDSLNANKLLAN